MTTRGTRIAFVAAALIALALPKRTECSFPGASCVRTGKRGTTCTRADIEPLGFYLIELAARRDVGFAYQTDEDCR